MLLDNKSQGKVGDVIGKALDESSEMAVLTSLFSIYGFAKLNRELSKVQNLRLAIGKSADGTSPTSVSLTGTVLSKNGFRGIEDFEVVSYLVIVEPNGEADGGAA